MPDTQKEKRLSSHAVLIVGYDDLKQTFTIRNSWGINHGDKGYYYIPYDYILDKELTNRLLWLSFQPNTNQVINGTYSEPPQ